jgi:hypothetical protein
MRTTSTTLGLRSTSVQIRIHSCLPEFLLSRPRRRAGERRRSEVLAPRLVSRYVSST